MKKLLLTILFIFITLIAFSVPKIINFTKKETIKYENILLLISKELNLDNITIQMHQLTYADDARKIAFSHKFNDTLYMININMDIFNKETFNEVLIHELVHISQMINKDLIEINDKIIIYKGIKYNRYVPHSCLQYEYDTERITTDIIWKYRKLF